MIAYRIPTLFQHFSRFFLVKIRHFDRKDFVEH